MDEEHTIEFGTPVDLGEAVKIEATVDGLALDITINTLELVQDTATLCGLLITRYLEIKSGLAVDSVGGPVFE